MKRKLRIVFMGTPDFAVESLQAIVSNGFDVTAVITAPDKPSGRGKKILPSAVKKYAMAENLKLMQPLNLKDEEFLGHLQSLNANLF
ncbi:MAG: formyltransferase family protein, partial [Bacteroidota bacterium]|nr:formyltransferase family protein [Bacteroidota bacterium]